MKQIEKACASYQNYEIVFERHFKYPLETDTLGELIKSTVYLNDQNYYIGWHQISYLKSETPRSLLASNEQGLHRVNYNDGYFYSNIKKDDENLWLQNLKANLYQPFLYGKADWDLFHVLEKKAEYTLISKSDSVFDAKMRFLYTYTTEITINNSTYLPESERTSTYTGKNVQYRYLKLRSLTNLKASNYKEILSQADSFARVVCSYIDGDSVKLSRKNLYKYVKVGDRVESFQADLLKGGKFNFDDYQDSIVIFDFFYTTCAPCIRAVPELNLVYDKFKVHGVSLFGINAFQSDWDAIDHYVTDHQVAYPILKTSKEVVYNFGVTGFPRLFVIKNGVIVRIYYGFTKGMDKQLTTYLETLIKQP